MCDLKNCLRLIPKTANIAITGAGAAGLQAAYKILNAGNKGSVFDTSYHLVVLLA